MQSGVDPHQPMPAVPVQHLMHKGAQRRQRHRLCRHHGNRPAFGLHGRGNDHRSAGPVQPPGIAWLATARRIEDRPVQHDAPLGRQTDDAGLGLGQVGIGAEQKVGHGCDPFRDVCIRRLRHRHRQVSAGPVPPR